MISFLAELENFARNKWIPVILGDGAEVLCDLVKKNQPAKILEIGTAIGYSGLMMLSNAPDNATLTTIEIDEERYLLAKDNFKKCGVSNRVTQILGDCVEFVRYADNKYDFIMLDGPKGQYNDMIFYLDRLLVSGGVIFADNIMFKGKAVGEDYPEHKHRTLVNALRKFVQEMNANINYECTLLEKGDGILIAQKK